METEMHMTTYESLEEMTADLARHEQAANENLAPAQIQMRDQFGWDADPVYWVRPYPELRCLIFGRAAPLREAIEESAKYVPARPADPAALGEREDYDEALDEALYEIASVRERRARGYMYGMAYSTMENRGELGDTHVANAFPISEEAFREAEAHGWLCIAPDALATLLVDPAALAEKTTPTLYRELRALQDGGA